MISRMILLALVIWVAINCASTLGKGIDPVSVEFWRTVALLTLEQSQRALDWVCGIIRG